MFLSNRLDGGRDGFTHLDWSTDGRPQFSLSADGEWLREGKPFAGRVELLGRLGVRSLCA